MENEVRIISLVIHVSILMLPGRFKIPGTYKVDY